MAHRSHLLLSALLAASAMTAGHAAELGEAQVLSHLGQGLVADVELTLIEDPAAKVIVRLANPDVYRGANIAMPPVLSSLNMTVMRRDGRQFLHLTSLKPVEKRVLHVYLELVDGGQRSVRLVSLWLTPDPNPAPPPLPLPVPEPVAAPVKVAPAPAPRPAAALQAGEEYVDAAKPVPPVARKVVVKAAPKPAPVRKPVAAPVTAAPAEAPACVPQAPSEQINACVALGEKNAALNQQLGKLEEKVKVLQGAGVIAAAAAPAPAPVPVPVVKEAPKDHPKGAPRIHRKPKKVEPLETETPWLPIGAAIGAMVAVGALVLALLRRRKRSTFGKIPAAHKPAKIPKEGEGEPKPHFMAAVKARLMPGKGKGPAPAAEPVAEQVE